MVQASLRARAHHEQDWWARARQGELGPPYDLTREFAHFAQASFVKTVVPLRSFLTSLCENGRPVVRPLAGLVCGERPGEFSLVTEDGEVIGYRVG